MAATAEPSATATGDRLDRADIQGDILRAHGNAYTRTVYLFLATDDGARGRAWLSGLVEQVATDATRPAHERPPFALNVAFTAAGLRAFGVPAQLLATFSDEFLTGMAARAELLGDVGDSAPARWDAGLGTGEAQLLLTLNALPDEQLAALPAAPPGALGVDSLDAALARLREQFEQAGLRIVAEQHAQLLDGAREQFGFADGFAQPAVAGASDGRAPGGGVLLRDGRWRPLATGEFILGHPDEDTLVDPQQRFPSAPAAPLGRNGTYMVWRKLQQDVALFRRTVAAAAERYPGGEAALRARIVGRWDDGAPLMAHPDGPPPQFDGRGPRDNDFVYHAADPDGMRCPLGAHVRRANPRDLLGFASDLTFRHRIIRRGMPYGPPLPPGARDDDGVDRGLVFVAFNASISRQFEAIQVQWLGDGNALGLDHDADFLLGSGTAGGSMVIPGRPPFYLAPQGPFVTTRGGEYLFAPGIGVLSAIAAGLG